MRGLLEGSKGHEGVCQRGRSCCSYYRLMLSASVAREGVMISRGLQEGLPLVGKVAFL